MFSNHVKNTFRSNIFIADVVDNNDPTNNYRLKVRIARLHPDSIPDTDLPWAAKVDSTFLGISSEGAINHSIPLIGSKVLVMAIADDANSLVYLGKLYKKVDGVSPGGEEYLQNWGIYGKNNQFIGFDKINMAFKLLVNGDIDIIVNEAKRVELTIKEDITVNCEKAIVNATSDVKINTKKTHITGDLDVDGNIVSKKEVSAKSGAVTLTGHTHPYTWGHEGGAANTSPGVG